MLLKDLPVLVLHRRDLVGFRITVKMQHLAHPKLVSQKSLMNGYDMTSTQYSSSDL